MSHPDTTSAAWVLERFEGDQALLSHDSGSKAWVMRLDLPAKSREGDCLLWQHAVWVIDTAETEKRKARQRQRLQRLFRREHLA